MSAIEVLKEIKKDYELDLTFRKQVQKNISKERINALNEVILALEQKKKTVLQNEIEINLRAELRFIEWKESWFEEELNKEKTRKKEIEEYLGIKELERGKTL